MIKPAELKELAAPAFATHKDAARLFITADRQTFLKLDLASAHAQTLKCRDIYTAYRPAMSKTEITAIEDQEKKEKQQATEAAFKSSFPEISRDIEAQKNKRR